MATTFGELPIGSIFYDPATGKHYTKQSEQHATLADGSNAKYGFHSREQVVV
jgi:hypothetical protein